MAHLKIAEIVLYLCENFKLLWEIKSWKLFDYFKINFQSYLDVMIGLRSVWKYQ